MGDDHDRAVVVLAQVRQRGFDARPGVVEDVHVIEVLGRLVEHRHLDRQGVPAVSDQANAQRLHHGRPVRVEAAPVQNQHIALGRVGIGFGVDRQEGIPLRFQLKGLAVEDGIDDLLGHALFARQIRLRRHGLRRKQNTDHRKHQYCCLFHNIHSS